MPEAASANPNTLTFEIQHYSGEVNLVICHGRLVAGTADVLQSAVRELIPTSKRIILKLEDVSHTDSMGLGTLVRLYVSAKSAGVSLELMHLGKQLQNLLGLTHLLNVFTVIGESGARFM
ncbi:MAG: STAS domain-containing protein [Acidobacteriaceae bacterium]